MGTKELATESLDADIYLTLGLKGSSKAVPGTPRILSLLSSLLERSVHKNEMQLETTSVKDVITIFHGLSAPPVSIRQYVDRIFKYSGCSPSCFVVAHIYVDRFLQQTDVRLNSLNVHRLLITSIMVAAKFTDDAFFNNAYYAKVGGVSTRELNRLEVKFLFSLDFRLQISVDTFRRYCYQMEKEAAEWLQIERPMQACRIKKNWSKKDDSTTCASTIAR
ncbi:cyclin-P3-1 isoform X2 [Tripterygium wilfordii]|uniref:Cyclin n=1 Tax=Tripterygium wilfordii TaxID=458696 RepID=A0A7J7CBH2_TRIWF|nr:cyclin-U3-1-like [Tripterygium wilfordii]XP_038682908.1 cyclin-U3-1-like [Tripterygium wilfordii]XP_038682909.1 cyclin-U3-1-like [Tripterygium wilfordii]KAF5731534.1 cyclin-P3-1 isoform X2 [Tripterygium wilfordii]